MGIYTANGGSKGLYKELIEDLKMEIAMPSELVINNFIETVGLRPPKRDHVVELSISGQEYRHRLSQIVDLEDLEGLKELCLKHLDVFEESYRVVIQNADDTIFTQVLYWLKRVREDAPSNAKEIFLFPD